MAQLADLPVPVMYGGFLVFFLGITLTFYVVLNKIKLI